jgi:hypothetical protein
MLKPATKTGKPALALTDLPNYTREVLGLRGLSLSTDLLVGADRKMLDTLRERGDKAGCACLTLVEPPSIKINATSEAATAAIMDRMSRVVQAAQILGCSSAAFHVEGVATEKDREIAAARLKQIVQRGEKLDVNILLGPSANAAIEPDMLTDVLKRVGGFRVGTFPDFESASKAKDPLTYLRRLSPYASAVCAATMGFESGVTIPPPPKAPGKQSASTALARLAQALAEMGDAPAAPAKGAKKGKAAPAIPTPIKPPPPLAAPKGEDDEELDEIDADDLLLGDDGEDIDEEPEAEPIPSHVGYDVMAMVAAVASVGYDGALLVDYRGGGDVTLGVQTSRKVLQAALDAALNAS